MGKSSQSKTNERLTNPSALLPGIDDWSRNSWDGKIGQPVKEQCCKCQAFDVSESMCWTCGAYEMYQAEAYTCEFCDGWEMISNYEDGDVVCTSCGSCTYDPSLFWCAEDVDHSTQRITRKSVHVPEKYLEKKMAPYKLDGPTKRLVIARFRHYSHLWQQTKTNRKYRPSYNFLVAKIFETLRLPQAALVPPIKTRSTRLALEALWQDVLQQERQQDPGYPLRF